jgi:hypothetical protein
MDSFLRLSHSEMQQDMSYVALKWFMTSPSYVNRHLVSLAVFGPGFRLMQKSIAQMALSRQCLSQNEIERSLLEELISLIGYMFFNIEFPRAPCRSCSVIIGHYH